MLSNFLLTQIMSLRNCQIICENVSALSNIPNRGFDLIGEIIENSLSGEHEISKDMGIKTKK